MHTTQTALQLLRDGDIRLFHWFYKTRNISQILSWIYNLYHENVKLLKAHWSSVQRIHERNFNTRKMETVRSSANEPTRYQNAGNCHLSTTCCESMKIYTDWSVLSMRNVFPVRQELSFNFSSHGSTALAGLDRPLWRSSITLPASHSAGLFCASDRPVAETSTGQHAPLTRDRYLCPRRDTHLQSPQASGRRLTSYTARPVGSAEV
jgi:hypothetical protein